MSGIYVSLEHEMCCPLCGDTNTHVDRVSMAARPLGEDGLIDEITIDAAGDDVSVMAAAIPVSRLVGSGRRHRIALHGWCESCDGTFAWLFTQHKGTTLVESVDMAEPAAHREAS